MAEAVERQKEFMSIDSLDLTARRLIAASKGNKVWLFSGEMGAGKTTLIKAIGKELGMKGSMSSPTFSIINEYHTDNGPLFHFDFYRLTDPGIVKLSVAEAIELGQDVIVVEWGNIISDVLPENKITIKLSSIAADSESRKIEISVPHSFEYLINSLPFRGVAEGGADTSEDLK